MIGANEARDPELFEMRKVVRRTGMVVTFVPRGLRREAMGFLALRRDHDGAILHVPDPPTTS